jgi:hypothetical protein
VQRIAVENSALPADASQDTSLSWAIAASTSDATGSSAAPWVGE